MERGSKVKTQSGLDSRRTSNPGRRGKKSRRQRRSPARWRSKQAIRATQRDCDPGDAPDAGRLPWIDGTREKTKTGGNTGGNGTRQESQMGQSGRPGGRWDAGGRLLASTLFKRGNTDCPEVGERTGRNDGGKRLARCQWVQRDKDSREKNNRCRGWHDELPRQRLVAERRWAAVGGEIARCSSRPSPCHQLQSVQGSKGEARRSGARVKRKEREEGGGSTANVGFWGAGLDGALKERRPVAPSTRGQSETERLWCERKSLDTSVSQGKAETGAREEAWEAAQASGPVGGAFKKFLRVRKGEAR